MKTGLFALPSQELQQWKLRAVLINASCEIASGPGLGGQRLQQVGAVVADIPDARAHFIHRESHGWLDFAENSDIGGVLQLRRIPPINIVLTEQHRHSVVNFGELDRGWAGEQRKCRLSFPARCTHCAKGGEKEERRVGVADEVRRLSSHALFPLKVPARRNHTTMSSKGLSKRRLVGCAFTSRVDQAPAGRGLVRPRRNETPATQAQNPSGAEHGNPCCRRDIVVGSKIERRSRTEFLCEFSA